MRTEVTVTGPQRGKGVLGDLMSWGFKNASFCLSARLSHLGGGGASAALGAQEP